MMRLVEWEITSINGKKCNYTGEVRMPERINGDEDEDENADEKDRVVANILSNLEIDWKEIKKYKKCKVAWCLNERQDKHTFCERCKKMGKAKRMFIFGPYRLENATEITGTLVDTPTNTLFSLGLAYRKDSKGAKEDLNDIK